MIKKVFTSLVITSVLLSTSLVACHFKSESNTSAKVIRAVSKTGLSATQTKKIAEGVKAYEATIVEIKSMQVFPVDSFIDEEFDEKRFIKEMSEKYMAAVAARATLYKYVFRVLNKEQRKIFKREYAAPLIFNLINSY